MAGFNERYVADKTLEADGVWVEFWEGFKVKLGRFGKGKHRAQQRLLLAPFQRYIDLPNIPKDVESEIEEATIRALAKGVILDWQGAEDEGEPVPYSEENVVKMLKKYDDFRKEVEKISAMQETFRRINREEDAKNSLKPSTGNSDQMEAKAT